MSKKIFVGNCSYNVNEAELQSFIESLEISVVSAKVITDRETGRSRGFAFVEVGENEDLTHVINTLNGKELDGRNLTVNEAKQENKRSGGGFKGGRDRRY
ncbi:RNA-binding protein [bacterium]|nr:RNA-binding protein [bacterium]